MLEATIHFFAFPYPFIHREGTFINFMNNFLKIFKPIIHLIFIFKFVIYMLAILYFNFCNI